jgi:hypothetical protein
MAPNILNLHREEAAGKDFLVEGVAQVMKKARNIDQLFMNNVGTQTIC